MKLFSSLGSPLVFGAPNAIARAGDESSWFGWPTTNQVSPPLTVRKIRPASELIAIPFTSYGLIAKYPVRRFPKSSPDHCPASCAGLSPADCWTSEFPPVPVRLTPDPDWE